MSDFALVDLVSQREAVTRHLRDKTEAEVLDWLRVRGRLTVVETPGRTVYEFESTAGRRAQFFFDSGELVFIGDHTTFT